MYAVLKSLYFSRLIFLIILFIASSTVSVCFSGIADCEILADDIRLLLPKARFALLLLEFGITTWLVSKATSRGEAPPPRPVLVKSSLLKVGNLGKVVFFFAVPVPVPDSNDYKLSIWSFSLLRTFLCVLRCGLDSRFEENEKFSLRIWRLLFSGQPMYPLNTRRPGEMFALVDGDLRDEQLDKVWCSDDVSFTFRCIIGLS